MNREPFSLAVRDAYIHGILHRPAPGMESTDSQAFIFLHGWGGYRTGPHDMLVKLADQLSESGNYSLRFDFRGKGYSGHNGFVPTLNSLREDMDTVVRYAVTELNVTKISLLGICSGAQLAFEYASAGPTEIANLICLSLPPLMSDEQTMYQTTLRETRQDLAHYAGLLLKRQTWSKLVNRQINFRLIFQVFNNKTSILYRGKRHHENTQDKFVNHPFFPHLTGQVLLIYGDKDPESSVSLQQAVCWLKKNAVHYSSFMIEGANHSFYSLSWEAEIENIIQNGVR